MVMLVLLPIVAVVVSSYMVYRGVENYIATSSYFKVRDLKVEGITDSRYVDVMKQQILGVNIFDDQVDKLSEKIKKKFPTFNSVIVMRVLPSTLQIVAKERIPVAVVRRDSFYLFDTEGVIVSSFTLSELIDFPVITGLDNKLRVLKVGASYRLGVLRDVLGLAKVLRQQRFYIDAGLPRDSRLKITRIDASDPDDFSFYLGESIEVKVGNRDFENKINLFSSILKSLSGDIVNVKYIDLRPKEPAVAMKKEASKR
jgi:cell division septal protein FtsQ